MPGQIGLYLVVGPEAKRLILAQQPLFGWTPETITTAMAEVQ